MFGWLKNMFTAAPADPPSGAPSPAVRDPVASEAERPTPLNVSDVVDAFLVQNPQQTPLGTLALIRAGACRLSDSDQIRDACESIAKHGYQYPLSPTIQRELPPDRLLDFLRWNEASQIGKDDYLNEHAVRDLIDRFQSE